MEHISTQEPDEGSQVSPRPDGLSSCPQLAFSEDSGPGSHSPLSLKVLAKQTIIMESDGTESDFSDIDFNTFAQRNLASPKLIYRSKDPDPYAESPDGSPKRKLDEAGAPQSPSKRQKDMYFTEVEESVGVESMRDLSGSSGDSAVGSSLFNTPLSRLSESSADSNTDTEDSYSPVHSARGITTHTGRYRKLHTSEESYSPIHFSDDHVSEQFMKLASDADSVRSLNFSNGNEGIVENLILHRLSDESLGMRLSVEGGKHGGSVRRVVVENVVEDGAAYRASGSSVGMCSEDEILEVNGTNLRRLTHDECLALFKDIPQRVHLVVKRAEPPPHRRMSGHGQTDRDVQHLPASSMPELGSLEGFLLQDVIVRKTEGENLGISIVPSYGTTRDFYQIKRLLPSGACARSGRLQVGDRLLQCNGQLLKGLTQAQCLSALKKGGDTLTFRILRQVEGDLSFEEIPKHESRSVEVNVCDSVTEAVAERDTGSSHRETVSQSLGNQPSISQVFAQKNVKLAFTQPFPHQQFSDESDSVTDSSMSSPVKERKDLLDNEDNLIDVGGFEIETTSTGQLDNTYVVDTPVVNLESTPRDWDTENETEYDVSVPQTHLPPIIEGIPPPTEFADGPLDRDEPPEVPSEPPQIMSEPPQILSSPPNIQSGPPTEIDQSVPVTNIDDLLGLDEDEVDSSEQNIEVTQLHSVQYSDLQRNNFTETVSTVTGDNTTETVQTIVTTSSESNNSEIVNDLLGDFTSVPPTDLASIGDIKVDFLEARQDENDNVTTVENTSIDDFISIGNVTQVPVATEDSAGVASQEDTIHVTSRSVNQHIVSKVTVSNEEDTKNLTNTPGSSTINANGKKGNSAVIQVNGNDTKKSTVITLDSNPKVKNTSPIHFTPPVQSSVKDENGEEIIQPMQMRREKGGVRVFAEGASASPKEGRRQVDPQARKDLADILLKLTASTEQILNKSNKPAESIKEDDIVPTKISREDAQTVLKVFEKWLSGSSEPSPAKVSPFKKMVSSIIDAKPGGKVTKIRVGSSSPLHVIPPVVNDEPGESGKEGIITPVLMRKDNKGVRSFETGSANSSPRYTPRVLDESAKRDLADILLGLNKSYEETYEKKKPVSSNSVAEQEIVPTKISKEDAKTLMNVFSNWMKKDDKSKASPFRKLVSNVIDDLEDDGKDELLTVTKEQNKTVIEQVHTSESASKPETVADVMMSVTTAPAFAPPKPAARSKKGETDMGQVQISNKVAPVPAPKPKSPREAVKEPQEPEVQMRHKAKSPKESDKSLQESEVLMRPKSSAAPPSPKLSLKSNRFSTGSLPPLTVSKAPPKMAGLSLNKTQGMQFTKMPKPEYQKMRREDGPFQVDVLKGIVGLGLKLQATPDGFTRVSDVQRNSPVDRNGQIKVGDYVLSINTTTMTGQSDSRIQQVLRLLPRGLAKIVVSVCPPSEADIPAGSTDSLSSSADRSGPTSPFGVRLGAKPFNTEESKSATVTSPLLRDSGYFDRRKTSLDKQTDQPLQSPPHVSTIDVTKSFSKTEEKKQESQPDSKHVSMINVKSVETVTEVVKKTPEVASEVSVVVAKTAEVVEKVPEVPMNIPKDSESVQKEDVKKEVVTMVTSHVTKNETKSASEFEPKVDVSVFKTESTTKVQKVNKDEEIVGKVEIQESKQEPVPAPKAAPRQKAQTVETVKEKEAVAEAPAKSPPRVPPKPKSRPSVKDEAPQPQPFISNIAVEKPVDKVVKPVDAKFVSNISVEKEMSPARNGVEAKVLVVDMKPKSPEVKTPPPVPPKPRRKSSASSDVSSSSVISDDLHYENEVDSGHRRRRKSSNSSEMSSGSLKSEKILEEPYVPRRKPEHAPEKRSVKEKMAAFEAFQKADNESPTRPANHITPVRKFSSSSQEAHVPRVSDPPVPRARSEKKNVPDEDGVFIVSRISINSQTSPEEKKDEPASPTSPKSPTSPLSPDHKSKINAALAPKRRTGLSEPKTKPEPGHHHAVPKTSSSIFKPTGLERLKNLAGHKTDSGEVAHSSSPEGSYKIGPVKMNSALSPRKSTSEEPATAGQVFGTAPHKLHTGEGRKIMSTSKLAGKKYVVTNRHAPNEDSKPALVKAKVVHIGNTSAPDTLVNDNVAPKTSIKDNVAPKASIKDNVAPKTNIKDNVAPSVSAQSSHSVVTPSYVTDHKHVDVSLEMKGGIDRTQTESTSSIESVELSTGSPTQSNVTQSSTQDTQTKQNKSESTAQAEEKIEVQMVQITEENGIERETENVQIKTEEVKEQIQVHVSENNLPQQQSNETEADDSNETPKDESLSTEAESKVAGRVAEKIVEASLEEAKEELSEVIPKHSKPMTSEPVTEQVQVDVVSQEQTVTESDSTQNQPETQSQMKEDAVSENDISVSLTEDIACAVKESQVQVPVTVDVVDAVQSTDDICEDELEKNASEIVSFTLEKAKKQMSTISSQESGPVSSPCPSPPPLPGSAPPPLPSGPPPPVPVAGHGEDLQAVDEDVKVEKASQNQTVPISVEAVLTSDKTETASAATEQVTEESTSVQKEDHKEAAPNTVLKPSPAPQEENQQIIVSEIQESVTPEVQVKETVELSEAPLPKDDAPPLPSGPPPPSQIQTEQKVDSTKSETQPETEEDNTWVQEIEKVAAQESKFDLLINFDSKEKVEIDDIQNKLETPTSDTDSGVSVQISSPITHSAITNGAEDSVVISDISKDTTSVQNSVKHITTSVETVVDSTVSGQGVTLKKDSEIDSGVESPGEGSNKTVTVQYSSNISSHEQDSFSSVDSLHDITPSVQSTVQDVEKSTQEATQSTLHASKTKPDSINVSVSQVSNSRESSPSAAPNDFESSKQNTSTEKIFSSTPTKECANSQNSSFEVNISRINSTSSRLNDSQNVSTTSSSVLNKSFTMSPRSKTLLNKRKWKMLSCSSGSSDVSVSDLTEVTDTSLVSKDELSSLLGQANQRMDRTGLSLEDEIVVLVLSRDNPEQELGLQLRDGILKSKIVCNLKPGSLAERDGRVQLKDSLLCVGDRPVEELSVDEIMKLLAEPSSHVTLVLSRRGSGDVSNGHSSSTSSLNGNGVESESPSQQGPGVFEVVMKKGVTGVGFCLEGGKGSPKGDMPILIKRIFKGGPAEKCGQLQVKDEILKVNNEDFTTMRHYEAWNYLKFLPDGDVKILIQRK